MKYIFNLAFLVFFINLTNAQIINGLDTLYGNEWINYDQSYFKISVAEDGIYRVNQQTLSSSNIPADIILGSQYQLFHNGEEVPIFTSTDGVFNGSDFIEFYGQKNTSELDRYLFKDPDAEMINPRYSLITDTAAYFLTWRQTGVNLRYSTIQNDLSNLPNKEPFFMGEYVLNYFSNFGKKADAHNISYSNFGMTDGFSKAFANEQTITLNPLNAYPGGADGKLKIRYGTNIGSHQQQITLNDQTLVTDEFNDYQVRELSFDVPNATYSASMSLKFKGLASNTDRQRIANIILNYPALFNFGNQKFFQFGMDASPVLRYLEIENFNASNSDPILYDLTSKTRMTVNFQNGFVKIALSPVSNAVKLALVNSTSGIKIVAQLTPIQFIDYSSINASYVILSNSKLYDDGSGINYVQEYANYRSSTTGGGYSVAIIDIQQLYDQFGWGLNRHPLSIRSFGHYIKKNWPAIKYFFILGKGRQFNQSRTASELSSATTYFVPTFGTPGSDNLLLSTNETSAPIIPIGRLAASTPEDINNFLKKIKDFEAYTSAGQTWEERQWNKKMMHLGGGGTAAEQSSIKYFLGSMADIVSNNLYGANVTSFYKTSTDPIQVSKSQQIFDRINKGVSIITFMGHSAVETFDFNIDNPDNYHNFGKYPIIFSLGCYSGNIHTAGQGISERFVLQKDKAAIGMVATTGQGYSSALYTVMSKFYSELGGDSYQQSMGVLLQKTIKYFDGSNNTQGELLQQFTYHGDPAIKIFEANGPDYLVDASSITISPKNIHVRQDSFTLGFKIANIGKNTGDSISIKIEHELPDGNRFTAASLQVKAPVYEQEYQVKLSTIGKFAVGRNKLYITVDDKNEAAELPLPAAELNNELAEVNGQKGVQFFIYDNGATPVYPTNYAIVGEQEVVLRASTSDALLQPSNFVFEIDTTQLFNSPIKKSTIIEQGGGIIEWRPDIAFENEKVYYWRISPDSISAEVGYVWENMSFTYIAGSPGGWTQRHYYQFLEDRMEDIKLSSQNRRFQFLEDYKDFRINNKVWSASNEPKAYIDGVWFQGFFRWDMQQSIHIAVFDTLGKEWRNPVPGLYGSFLPTAPNPVPSFPFSVDNADQRQKIIEFIENVIPANHLVFVYSAQRNLSNDLKIHEWASDSTTLNGKNLFNVLEANGATHIRALETNLTPYVFSFVKGVSPVIEKWADSPTGEINIEMPIEGYWYEGKVTSNFIGPSSKWKSLSWDFDSSDVVVNDTFYIDIYGFSKDKNYSTLLFEKTKLKVVDLSLIKADSFPFLRLEYYAKDSLERSPIQLQEWNVIYDGIPDAAFNTYNNFTFHRDTLEEGDKLRLESNLAATNQYSMDSLLVRYEIKDKSGNIITVDERQGKLIPSNGLNLSFSYPTKGMKGEHQLTIQLNPDEDQPELYSFNNFLTKDFYVKNDERNPLLDVTFDGIHILNGDIIAPNPEIIIALKDENQYLLLEDTSTYKLYLVSPQGDLTQIPLNSPEISLHSATSSSDNRFTLRWKPEFTLDGEYSLIVQASDVTGNSAGNFDYKINFKVVLETAISNILAYPNPFSTATRFVYTLTGEAPQYFKIQIMTIAGKIVREINQDEIGPLHIGTHQTDFTWDGTDEFGDRLANGVYLYRVLVKDGNKAEYKNFETGTNSFFKNGFGKLAIIR